jgi:hypothetical protein
MLIDKFDGFGEFVNFLNRRDTHLTPLLVHICFHRWHLGSIFGHKQEHFLVLQVQQLTFLLLDISKHFLRLL